MYPRAFVAKLHLLFALCTSLILVEPIRGENNDSAWSAVPLGRAISIRDGRTDTVLALDAFLDALASADVVFLGEQHGDETTHRIELAVYEGLLARKKDKVVLAMEMFERDVQAELDKYLAGEIDEARFLAHVRPWGNYDTAYRPLVERAKDGGLPVVASNFPAPFRMRLAMDGAKAFETLQGQTPGQVPKELLPNTPAYWRRVDNAVRGHLGRMRRVQGDAERLYSTQSLWDNSMGEACAIALDKYPDHIVLHINGGFHSAYWDGTVHQFRLRKPKARIKTVAIVPVTNPSAEELGGAVRADYIVLAEERATDLNDGTWSVYVQRELKYRLHVPNRDSDAAPVPLLLWLSDDGFTASDGIDLWKDRLGGYAAIAAIEAPYRETQVDSAIGGRWFWADTFAADVGAMATGIERTWAYILRHYPIDPSRVCVAGEGTGATIAAATALLSDRMAINGIALKPRRYAKIKDFPLPLPEYWGEQTPPDKSLSVLGNRDAEAWWTSELAEYAKIDMKTEMVPVGNDPWEAELRSENAIRAALGLGRRPAATAKSRRYILIESESPRTRHWARLHALSATAKQGVPIAVTDRVPDDNNATRFAIDIQPESFSESDMIPKCPGPFGGTTVLVLREAATDGEVQRWLEVERNDPLARKSRFHRVRIATGNESHSLANVLSTLRSENRKNILIVPAVFCAEPDRMRDLRRCVQPWEDQMTFHWMPGLGGQKAALSGNAIPDQDAAAERE